MHILEGENINNSEKDITSTKFEIYKRTKLIDYYTEYSSLTNEERDAEFAELMNRESKLLEDRREISATADETGLAELVHNDDWYSCYLQLQEIDWRKKALIEFKQFQKR